jgi:hypothetical protein
VSCLAVAFAERQFDVRVVLPGHQPFEELRLILSVHIQVVPGGPALLPVVTSTNLHHAPAVLAPVRSAAPAGGLFPVDAIALQEAFGADGIPVEIVVGPSTGSDLVPGPDVGGVDVRAIPVHRPLLLVGVGLGVGQTELAGSQGRDVIVHGIFLRRVEHENRLFVGVEEVGLFTAAAVEGLEALAVADELAHASVKVAAVFQSLPAPVVQRLAGLVCEPSCSRHPLLSAALVVLPVAPGLILMGLQKMLLVSPHLGGSSAVTVVLQGPSGRVQRVLNSALLHLQGQDGGCASYGCAGSESVAVEAGVEEDADQLSLALVSQQVARDNVLSLHLDGRLIEGRFRDALEALVFEVSPVSLPVDAIRQTHALGDSLVHFPSFQLEGVVVCEV